MTIHDITRLIVRLWIVSKNKKLSPAQTSLCLSRREFFYAASPNGRVLCNTISNTAETFSHPEVSLDIPQFFCQLPAPLPLFVIGFGEVVKNLPLFLRLFFEIGDQNRVSSVQKEGAVPAGKIIRSDVREGPRSALPVCPWGRAGFL